MEKLVDLINHFHKMLNKYPDNTKYTYDFYSFFKSLTLANHDSDYIPIIELGTIFKYKKPIIFFEMRKFSRHSEIIDVITSVEMDLKVATEKVSNIIKQ